MGFEVGTMESKLRSQRVGVQGFRSFFPSLGFGITGLRFRAQSSGFWAFAGLEVFPGGA